MFKFFDISKTLHMKSSGPLAGLFLFKNQSVVQNSQALWQGFGPGQNCFHEGFMSSGRV